MNQFESKVWIEWIGSRPESIRKAAEEYPPGVYKLNIDGEASAADYQLIGYTEEDDDSVTVILRTDGLSGMLPREVFGVKLTDLMPIDTLKTRGEI